MPKRRTDRDAIWIAERKDSPNLYLCHYDPVTRHIRWQSCGTNDRAEAERQKAATALGIGGSRHAATNSAPQGPGAGLKLFQTLDTYWDRRAQNLPSWERNKVAIGHFKRHFGDVPLNALTFDAQADYVDARDELMIAPATISTELSTLRAAINWTMHGADPSLIPIIYDVNRGDDSRKRWLTYDEAGRLLNACRSSHIRLFMTFVFYTAARPIAVLDLKWQQIDFDADVIFFNPAGRVQTNKRRPTIRMRPELKAELAEAYREAVEKAERLKRPISEYVVEYGAYPVGSIRKAFRNTALEAGFEDVTPYTLRHTAATWMAQDGVDLWDIAGFLGTSMKMVEKHYAHHHPDFQKRSATATAKAMKIVKQKRPSLTPGERRPTRAEVLAARVQPMASASAVSPQLHHRNEATPDIGRPIRRKKSKELKGKRMVGGTGIEPVTPTMST